MARTVGTVNHFEASSVPSLTLPISMAIWARPSTFTGSTVFGVGGSPSAPGQYIALGHLGTGAFFLEEGAGASDSTTTHLAKLNQWNHYVGVLASATSRPVFGNGVAGTTGTGASYTPGGGLNRLNISGLYITGTLGSFSSADVAHACFWSGYALTATDVKWLWAGLHPLDMKPEFISGYWPLAAAAKLTDTEPDLVGGRTMALTGTPPALEGPPILPRGLNRTENMGQALQARGPSSAGTRLRPWVRPRPAAPAVAAAAPQQITITQALETDQAAILIPFMAAAEVSAAQALDIDKLVTIGPALETDAAQALVINKAVTLIQALEVDAAQALDVDKLVTLAPATATDAAQALTEFKAVTLGQALETDRAAILVPFMAAQETDRAAILLPFMAATEVDAAQPLTKFKAVALTFATETDAAQALDIDKLVALTFAAETDRAAILVPFMAAQEVDRAAILLPFMAAQEVDRAAILVPFMAAMETDVAIALTFSQSSGAISMTLVPALETDAAAILLPFMAALETSAAQPLTMFKAVTFAPATETDAAQAITAFKAATLTPATELDTAIAVTFTGGSAPTYTIVYAAQWPHANTIDGPLVVESQAVNPLMFNNFMRDGAVDAPIIITTVANAVLPLAMQHGLLRDARGYLVVIETP